MKVDHDVNIENDTESYFHADFANQYIGGGVLGGGCVQEEVRNAVLWPLLLDISL